MNVLAIGGLDPSGSAGLAADVKTLMAWNAHGLPVITVITAQNTVEVTGFYPVDDAILRAQIEAVVSDIDVHAVKIGLLGSVDVLQTIVSVCKKYRFSNIVVDPVLRSTTEFDFADSELIDAYKKNLFPLADVITPNLHEASLLTGINVNGLEGMKEASLVLHRTGVKNVVITGGHLQDQAIDVLYDGKSHHLFETSRVENKSTRGLGCTFASILAVHLAGDKQLEVGIRAAKEYIGKCLETPLSIGSGKGPLRHFAP